MDFFPDIDLVDIPNIDLVVISVDFLLDIRVAFGIYHGYYYATLCMSGYKPSQDI